MFTSELDYLIYSIELQFSLKVLFPQQGKEVNILADVNFMNRVTYSVAQILRVVLAYCPYNHF